MNAKAIERRYRHWNAIIEDWSISGLTKRAYCQEKGIAEKQFLYYQSRVRTFMADHGSADNADPKKVTQIIVLPLEEAFQEAR